MNININHTIASIDKSTGGPARSVTHLVNSVLNESEEINVDLSTLSSNDPIINSFAKKTGNIYFFRKKINYNKIYDLYHSHGIWQKPMHDMIKEAKINNKPYIVTVRGMLEPWSLKQKYIKKKIALFFYQYSDLKGAACIHATGELEVESIRKLGLNNPIALIPNGVNIDEFPREIPVKSKKKKILFLSRIHKKKGIEYLIEAWMQLDAKLKENWIIEIIGNGECNYIEELKEVIIKNKLNQSIFILPPVYGENKIKIYRESSLFVLPTFSENFGVVIAEALASYTPVITTIGTPWADLTTHNCGWWIDTGVKPLVGALNEAMSLNELDLIQKGVDGRKLIEEKYSIKSVAKKVIELYSWVLGFSKIPSFVKIIKNE
jgi:glycosyltransferase involved in cell wall biosynthesis